MRAMPYQKAEKAVNPQDLEHARIYDRIMERCMPVFFGGKNYRSELGQGNRDTAKKILTGAKNIV